MSLSRSKVTSQGQISVPADVRRKLGIEPGSMLEWDEEGGNVIVRRSGTFSSEDIHRVAFGGRAPATRTLEELREGIERYIRDRHARD